MNIEKPEVLLDYLKTQGMVAPTERPRIQTLPGGVSNRTVLVEREDGEAWVIKQALAKLRVPVDWYSDPIRIHREALGLRWLAHLAPAGTVPEFIYEDHQDHILIMRAVPQPHTNWKTALLAGQVNFDYVRQFGALLGTIHRQADQRRQDLIHVFDDRSFFESLRLEPYYSYTATQTTNARAFLLDLIRETKMTRLTLVHGDYSPKNILICQDRLVLLDYEVIHFGDPAFDIGFSMTHLLSKANHLPAQREVLAEAARLYWQTYQETLGPVSWTETMEARAGRHTLACLLARVDGRSPLEYLNETARNRQRTAVLSLMQETPSTITGLIHDFLEAIAHADS